MLQVMAVSLVETVQAVAVNIKYAFEGTRRSRQGDNDFRT